MIRTDATTVLAMILRPHHVVADLVVDPCREPANAASITGCCDGRKVVEPTRQCDGRLTDRCD